MALFNNKKRRLVRGIYGIKRDTSGATAVEFAIIVPFFLGFMFSLFEVGWFYYTNSVVDASIANAARLIQTGQVQEGGLNLENQQTLIFDSICDVLKQFGNCNEVLTVEVETFPNFATLIAPSNDAICPDTQLTEGDEIPFDPGGELDIVRVRVCFLFKTINPALGVGHSVNLNEGDSNKRRLISSIVFRNEPFERQDATNG